MSSKIYSLRKSRNLLRENFALYKRKVKKLTASQKESLESTMSDLEQLIFKKEREQASNSAKELEKKSRELLPKTIFDFTKEILFALIFALVIATLVRTMWFEPYRIPTGSMRPTFKEQDHLVVSKTDFGINVPLQAKHFYFDPNLIQHNGIVIFSIDQMDIANPDTTYFYLFPGKKLLIKRLIGKPGDTIYFYGGKIYGIDKDGNDLKVLREAPYLKKIDHVPYLSFDGKVKQSPSTNPKGKGLGEYYFYQMNLPVGQLTFKQGAPKGYVFNGSAWVLDTPNAANKPHTSVVTYSDLWGMKNYAMTRLLTPDQLSRYSDVKIKEIGNGLLYMEFFHSPNLVSPSPRIARDEKGQFIPLLTPMKAVIPLQQQHIEALKNTLYTARFVVENGYAFRWEDGGASTPYQKGIALKGIPDGTYEFYYGTAYSVNSWGITKELPKNHPLYNSDIELIQALFNLGIEFNSYFSPNSSLPLVYASRFSYFRDGDLYSMGGKIFDKNDPTLIEYVSREKKRQSESTASNPYLPFFDYGAPLINGQIDAEFIKSFGIKVPEKMYLVLGDNYAMSGDSREFGFVPEDNLRGGPWMILWPPGKRWFSPLQPQYPWFTAPQLIVWAVVILIAAFSGLYYYKRAKKPIFKSLL